jgi:hypothetical protein
MALASIGMPEDQFHRPELEGQSILPVAQVRHRSSSSEQLAPHPTTSSRKPSRAWHQKWRIMFGLQGMNRLRRPQVGTVDGVTIGGAVPPSAGPVAGIPAVPTDEAPAAVIAAS